LYIAPLNNCVYSEISLFMTILVGDINGRGSIFAVASHKEIQDKNGQKAYTLGEIVFSKEYGYEKYSSESSNGVQVLQENLQTFINEFYSSQLVETQEDIHGLYISVGGFVEHEIVRATVGREDFQATFTKQDFICCLPEKYRLAVKRNWSISFLNDMEALGYSIFIDDGEMELVDIGSIQSTKDLDKLRRALVLIGEEGLGEALWCWNKDVGKSGRYSPISSEGGHKDFADPTPDKGLSIYLEGINKEEARKSNPVRIPDPVSYEQVLSFRGLPKICKFLYSTERYSENKEFVENISAELIIQQAQQPSGSILCKHSLDLFIQIMGAEAGNVALQYNASGGVYVVTSSSISTEKLRDGIFESAFINKEKHFRKINSETPVKVLSIHANPYIFLQGAARYAISDGCISRGKFSLI